MAQELAKRPPPLLDVELEQSVIHFLGSRARPDHLPDLLVGLLVLPHGRVLVVPLLEVGVPHQLLVQVVEAQPWQHVLVQSVPCGGVARVVVVGEGDERVADRGGPLLGRVA